MKRSFVILVGLVLSGTTCGGGRQAVKPDEMSADQHRQEAEHERRLASEERDRYRPEADRQLPGDKGGDLFPQSVYNPTTSHFVAAQAHENHARQHEAAARYLQKFEEGECRRFPPSTRTACPLLGPVSGLEDIPGGVRVQLASGTRADAVVAHMRCHYAYARARAFAENVTCPLYIPGIDIRQGREPSTVEIVSGDAVGEREIRARSRQEAVFEKRSGAR
jgi:hypothetical protein